MLGWFIKNNKMEKDKMKDVGKIEVGVDLVKARQIAKDAISKMTKEDFDEFVKQDYLMSGYLPNDIVMRILINVARRFDFLYYQNIAKKGFTLEDLINRYDPKR